MFSQLKVLAGRDFKGVIFYMGTRQAYNAAAQGEDTESYLPIPQSSWCVILFLEATDLKERPDSHSLNSTG